MQQSANTLKCNRDSTLPLLLFRNQLNEISVWTRAHSLFIKWVKIILFM